jgi:alpha-D-ribose 1-methylphosphonate 5-triphosphate synthase subunit PhnH
MAITAASTAHVDIGIGFVDPVRDSQAVFRIVLDAMANPGRIMSLPRLVEDQHRLGPSATAVCLALVDYETPLWLDPQLADPDTSAFLLFHCGAPIASGPETADFAVLDGMSAPLGGFKTGSDAYPEDGATVIIQVPDLSTSGALTLAGPGVDGERRLGIGGLSRAFWSARAEINAGFPRGIDLIFCAGGQLAALPRTTRVWLSENAEAR